MLAKQILAVIIAIGCPDDNVDVFSGGLPWIGDKPRQIGGSLVIEFDQNNRAVDPVIVDAVRLGSADPGETGSIEIALTSSIFTRA